MSALIFDLSKIKGLQQKIALLGKTDRKALLESIGAEVESQTQRRITDEQTSPDGSAWSKWSEKYKKTRHGNQDLLQNEGDLVRGITTNPPSGDSIEVGSPEIYSNTHLWGDSSRGIPQRQFLGLSPQNIEDLQIIINEFLSNHLRQIA